MSTIVRFIVYDLADGRIKRRCSAPGNQIEIQRQPGEGILLGDADQATQYVDLSGPIPEVRTR